MTLIKFDDKYINIDRIVYVEKILECVYIHLDNGQEISEIFENDLEAKYEFDFLLMIADKVLERVKK